MGNINICGNKNCGGCPDVTTDADGKEVTLKEGCSCDCGACNNVIIKLTFEQVGTIYKQMCIRRNSDCKCDSCCDGHGESK